MTEACSQRPFLQCHPGRLNQSPGGSAVAGIRGPTRISHSGGWAWRPPVRTSARGAGVRATAARGGELPKSFLPRVCCTRVSHSCFVTQLMLGNHCWALNLGALGFSTFPGERHCGLPIKTCRPFCRCLFVQALFSRRKWNLVHGALGLLVFVGEEGEGSVLGEKVTLLGLLVSFSGTATKLDR